MKWPLVKFEEVVLPVKGAIVSGPFGSNISSRFFVEEGIYDYVWQRSITGDFLKTGMAA